MSNNNNNNKYKTRNIAACQMGNRFKSKRFNNDRAARRPNDVKNSHNWKSEVDDYFDCGE